MAMRSFLVRAGIALLVRAGIALLLALTWAVVGVTALEVAQ
jgi:hypothetical protein